MITLYGTSPMFGLPEASPYVMKTEIHLMMAGLPYQKLAAGPQQGPKGKIPFIDDDGTVLGDSTFIRAHIERTRGLDLDAGLTDLERAQAWAIERMMEDHLGWASGCFRWLDEANFEKGPAHFMDDVPEPARAAAIAELYDRVKTNMTNQGMARHSPAEIAWLGARSLAALSAILGDNEFLFGDRPTGADATAYSILAGVLTPFFDMPLRTAAEAMPNLVTYAARMEALFYPGFSQALAA